MLKNIQNNLTKVKRRRRTQEKFKYPKRPRQLTGKR